MSLALLLASGLRCVIRLLGVFSRLVRSDARSPCLTFSFALPTRLPFFSPLRPVVVRLPCQHPYLTSLGPLLVHSAGHRRRDLT